MLNETNSTQEAASVSGASKMDQIADLLMDEKDKKVAQNDPEPEQELDDEEQEVQEFSKDDVEDEGPEETEGEGKEAEEQDVTWAGVLNVDESKLVLDDDGNFKAVKVKIDGKEDQVDLNTLIAGYQTAKSTTQKAQALAAERKQFEEASFGALNLFKAKLDEAEAFTQILHKKMVSEYEGINWQQLRMQNPAEYAAAMTDFQQRQADIANMMRSIQGNRVAAENFQKQQQEESRNTFIKEQAKRTLEMFPDWSDPKKAQADLTEMRDFVSDYGFSPEEFKEIVDPRILAVLKAVISIKKAEKESAGKVVTPTPPRVRRSTSTRTGTKKVTKLDRLVKRAQTATGAAKRSAQTDAVAELLLNG